PAEARQRASPGPRTRVTLAGAGATPDAAEVGAGSLALDLVNRLDAPITVLLENVAWPDTAATAAFIGTLAEFRDLFSAEVLAPGLEVAIESLAFLFTDLTGSTALYQAIGQARAFRLVQGHFVVLGTAIPPHGRA